MLLNAFADYVVVFDLRFLGTYNEIPNLVFVTTCHLLSSTYVLNFLKVGKVAADQLCLYRTAFEWIARKLRSGACYASMKRL